MLKGFRDFIMRGNVIDLAVAVILGTAFNSIVSKLVADIINPLLAATLGKPDFSYIVFHVRPGAGAVLIGDFLNAVISFLLIAASVYFAIVVPMNAVMKRLKKPAPPAVPTTRPCPQCLSEIPPAATRCAHCTQPVSAATPAS
jgi:large conductance mechanosensitive channel